MTSFFPTIRETMDLVGEPQLSPAEPLWKRVPTRDDEGRPVSDFMMLIPKFRSWPQERAERPCSSSSVRSWYSPTSISNSTFYGFPSRVFPGSNYRSYTRSGSEYPRRCLLVIRRSSYWASGFVAVGGRPAGPHYLSYSSARRASPRTRSTG